MLSDDTDLLHYLVVIQRLSVCFECFPCGFLSLADNLNIRHGSMVVNIKNPCYTRVGVSSLNMQVNAYKSSQGNATRRVQNQSPNHLIKTSQ
nr:MAG TPA: hypothetical protein [Caudoviricetes sp.]